jgi:integrase
MACLFRRGGIWTARIFVDGRERWRSLRTRDRREAEQKAHAIEALLKGDRWLRQELDELLSRARREALADEVPLLCETVASALRDLLGQLPADQRDSLAMSFSRRLLEQQQRKLPISDGWGAWLATASRSKLPKERTLEGYHSTWDRFASWAERRGLIWFHELDESGTVAYADHLWSQRITPRTFTAHITHLRSVWNTLRVQAGLTQNNPWTCVKPKTTSCPAGRRDLTPEELRTVISTATGSLRLLLLAGALTGARLGDVVSMRWTDIDLAAGKWSFGPMKTSRTGRRLTLPLLSPLLEELRRAEARKTGPIVFPVEYGLWERHDLTTLLSQHFERCGIVTREATKSDQPRRKARVLVGFHSLRHTVATLAARSGANLALVQKTLGHSSPGMSAHYTHADAESVRNVLEPLAAVLSPIRMAASHDSPPAAYPARARIQPTVESDRADIEQLRGPRQDLTDHLKPTA